MVPKKSQFSPKGLNFAFVVLFRGRSQIPNPVLERLAMVFLLVQGDQANDASHKVLLPMCKNVPGSQRCGPIVEPRP